MNKYKTLVSNAALISAGTFGSKLLVFLMVRFYTSYLTPADYGVSDLITQTANLLIPLVSLGITDGVFRFAIDRKGARASVFTAGFCTISAGCLLFAGTIPLLRRIPAVREYVWLVAAFVAASCYHALCAQFIRASGNTALFAGQGLLNTALVIGLNILFLAVFHMGIAGYVLSVAAANCICTIFLIGKETLWRQLVFRPRRGIAWEMLRYSIPLIPTSVFWWITSVSDRYMVSAFLGSEANGIYSVAYKIPTILTILSTVFMEAWQLSAVTESHGSRREHIHFYSKVWSAFQPVMFLCGAGVIALSRPAIRLLANESYYSAWRCIPLLATAMVFASFSNFMGSVYVVTRKSALSFWTSMVGAGANVALNLLLIPSALGIQGAAAATLLSYVIVFSIRTVSARKLIAFRLYTRGVVAGAGILTVQTVFMVFELPMWGLVQVLGIALTALFSIRPVLAGAAKLGIVKGNGRGRPPRAGKGEYND